MTLSYFAFYTAYDKGQKKLVLKNLTDMVTLKRGLDWTLVELNKAVSLSGLTTMTLAFLPQFKSQSKDLLFISMSSLWLHSIYSSTKFYQNSLTKFFKEGTVRKISITLGSLGQLALAAGYWGHISPDVFISTAIGFGIAHFWSYEVDYKYVLQVRPYAYLPFPLAGYALFEWFLGTGRAK